MARKYHATQALAVSGWESGTEIELNMLIDFTVTEYRPQTHIDPEEPCQVEDITVCATLGTDEVILPKWLIENFTKDDGFKDWLLSEAADSDECARDHAADARREDRLMEVDHG